MTEPSGFVRSTIYIANKFCELSLDVIKVVSNQKNVPSFFIKWFKESNIIDKSYIELGNIYLKIIFFHLIFLLILK